MPDRTIETRESVQLERMDFKLRGQIICGILRPYYSRTGLVQDRDYSREDIVFLHEGYEKAAPFAHSKLYPNFWEHCLYSSILAGKIAEKVGSPELSPREAEALAFIGDDSSIAVPHRYARKNIVANIFDSSLRVRKEELSKQPPVLGILGLKVFRTDNQVINSINDMTLPQIILDFADNLGKINSEGTPRSLAQNIEYAKHLAVTYAGGLFPSERTGLKALVDGKQKLFTELLEEEALYLSGQFGVNINEMIEAAMDEYALTKNQLWLRQAKQAQETLDPAVDKTLNRPKIQTVVFDAGGVLMMDAVPLLIHYLTQYFSCSEDQVKKALLDTDAFSGKISEASHLGKMWQDLSDRKMPHLEEARKPFVHPEIYKPMPQMQKLVNDLSSNPAIQVYVLSDAIQVVTPTVTNWIREAYPSIPANHILVSNTIKASKKEKDALAFSVLLEKIGNPNPESVLFIDDNPGYSTAARSKYNIRAMHFRENDPERLIQELNSAKLV